MDAAPPEGHAAPLDGRVRRAALALAETVEAADGAGLDAAGRARSHCHFVLLLIHFIPDSLTYLVTLCLKR